jgi:monoamine oxidase
MRTSRIVVVGAGLSGLTAALRLVHAGLDVVVLEARGRVGGHAWRIELDDGLTWDAG